MKARCGLCRLLFLQTVRSFVVFNYNVFRKASKFQVSLENQNAIISKPPSSWQVPQDGLSGIVWDNRDKPELTTATNSTLPIAMMVLDETTFPTKSMAQRAIRSRRILVRRRGDNNVKDDDSIAPIQGKCDTRIFPGDVIYSNPKKFQQTAKYQGVAFSKPSFSVPVMYQDDHMAVINKPAGMICHSHTKGGFDSNSVLRALPHVLDPPRPGTEGILELPNLIHRLDMKTCGLLVVAKTHQAAVELSRQFLERTVEKTYHALVEGIPDYESSVIHSAIDDKNATTEWSLLETFSTTTKGPISLVEFHPKTGRKHQLRKHAAKVLGCPIVGDEMYGSRSSSFLFLCSSKLACFHPIKKDEKISTSLPLPQRFRRFIDREKRRYKKYELWIENNPQNKILP